MPRTIQKHVLVSFLRATFLCLTIILGLTVMLDFVQRIDNFSLLINSTSESWWFVISYYALRLPFFAGWLIPIILLAAICVTLVRMNRKNQLVPFMMAGFSVHQILLPIYLILCSGMIGIFSIQEWVLPGFSSEFARTQQKLQSGDTAKNILTVAGAGTFLQCRTLHPGDGTLTGVTLMTFQRSSLQRIIKAKRAKWNKQKKQWVFRNGRITTYTARGYRKDPPASFSTWTWRTDLSPTSLLKTDSEIQFFRLSELFEMIEKWPHLRFARMKLHTRFSYPFFAFILPFFGLPILLRREIKSYFLGGVYCAGITIGVYLLFVLFQELGNSAVVHPILASWFPIVLTGSICLYAQEQVMT